MTAAMKLAAMNLAAMKLAATMTMARSEPAASSSPVRAESVVDVAAMTAGMAGGDAKWVEVFYRRYFEAIYREARRATRKDEAFCLDVVQETVLRVLRTVRAVSSEGRLVAWLKLVVRTTAYDLLRNDRRRRKREAGAPATVPSDDAVNEQLEWIGRQLRSLDPQVARLIEMRYERRWTLSRIASAVGLSLGAVDRRLRKALLELRDAARADWPQDVRDE